MGVRSRNVCPSVVTVDVWAHSSQPMFRNGTEATLEFY